MTAIKRLVMEKQDFEFRDETLLKAIFDIFDFLWFWSEDECKRLFIGIISWMSKNFD